jgi:hypothetical protein
MKSKHGLEISAMKIEIQNKQEEINKNKINAEN